MTEQVKLVNGKKEYYESYFGDVGARVYQENRERSRQKGIEKYDQDFLKLLPESLKPSKGELRIHSVDTFTHQYQKDNPDKRVPCTKTVYNLIDRGELDVRNIDLPRKTSLRPRRKKPTDPHGTNHLSTSEKLCLRLLRNTGLRISKPLRQITDQNSQH